MRLYTLLAAVAASLVALVGVSHAALFVPVVRDVISHRHTSAPFESDGFGGAQALIWYDQATGERLYMQVPNNTPMQFTFFNDALGPFSGDADLTTVCYDGGPCGSATEQIGRSVFSVAFGAAQTETFITLVFDGLLEGNSVFEARSLDPTNKQFQFIGSGEILEQFDPNPVPIPGALAFMATGLGSLMVARRRLAA